MLGRWHIAWFLVGFAIAMVLAVAFEPAPARAQGTQRLQTEIVRPPARQPVEPRRGGGPAAAPAEPALRPTISSPALLPEEEEEDSDAEPQDGDLSDARPARRAGQRGAPEDGDLSLPRLPEALRDGIVDNRDPALPEDGADPTRIDSRDPDDAALFEQPPAGFDPLLFQAEIEPILDRRPARLFRFEPFDPTGIPVGSFVLLPEIETSGVWIGNVFRSPNDRATTALDVRPAARLVSNWRRHALEFRANGTLTFLNEFSSENDRAYLLEARGRLDITRLTSIEALVGREVVQESRSSIDAAATAAERADITTDRAAVTLNHRFNRLSLQLRGGIADQTFGSVADAGGGPPITSRDRNVRTTEGALRATWEFKPTLFAFAEFAANRRDFEAAPASDNILRDSHGTRTRIGVSFGNTGQRLRGEAAIGWGEQRPDDRRLPAIEGLIFDANLAYRLNGLTSFLLSARSDVTDTTQAGSAGAWSRQVGLDIRHAFLRSLIGTAGLSYTSTEFSGAPIEETEWRGTLALEYFLNRNVVVFGRYQHVEFGSTEAGRDYSADEVRVGVRLRH